MVNAKPERERECVEVKIVSVSPTLIDGYFKVYNKICIICILCIIHGLHEISIKLTRRRQTVQKYPFLFRLISKTFK